MEMPFFCFYFNYKKLMKPLSCEEKGRLLDGLIYYAETGEEPELPGKEQYIWPAFQMQLDRDLEKYEKKCQANRANGAKGGRKKATEFRQETEDDEANASETQQKPKETQQEPSKTQQEPTEARQDLSEPSEPNKNKNKNSNKKENLNYNKTPSGGGGGVGFESFWEAYPRKVGKQEAMKAFSKIRVPLDTLLEALELQKRSDQWTRDGGRYVPYPATWLNQARWEDDPGACTLGRNDVPTMEDYWKGLEEYRYV